MKTIHPWNEHKRTEPTTYERHISGNITRAPLGEGFPLERVERSDVIRVFRSRYVRHVGEKQKRKAVRRSLMSEEARLAALEA